VLFDQRGSGRSRPPGETRHNHTGELVADIERLRAHLGIVRWLVFGGSWGAALAAAYAAAHPSACAGALLRGIFLTGRRDLEWFFGGAADLFPEEWERFAGAAPKRHRRNLLHWLARTFESGSADDQQRAAAAWQAWEQCLGGSPPVEPPAGEALERLVAKYRVQSHYLARRCFLGEARVLRDVSLLRGFPVAFVHGRQDLVCRPENAWRASRTLSGSRLIWVDGAGHDPFHPAMARALARATDRYAAHGDFGGPR
jgi:proline iminopeptidase